MTSRIVYVDILLHVEYPAIKENIFTLCGPPRNRVQAIGLFTITEQGRRLLWLCCQFIVDISPYNLADNNDNLGCKKSEFDQGALEPKCARTEKKFLYTILVWKILILSTKQAGGVHCLDNDRLFK